MIVADRKDINEILDMIKDVKKVLVAGCKGCVTVCNVGGSKEVGILAAALKIARKKEEKPIEVDEVTLESLRQAKIVKFASVKSRRALRLKILGRGTLEVENLKVKVHSISKTAREKLEQAKGSVEIIQPRKKKPRRKNS